MKATKRGVAAGRAKFGMPVTAVLVLAVLCAGARPAAAGQDPGIRVGYFGGANADAAVPAVGVYGRFDIPGPLNLELSADYRREKAGDGVLESTVIPFRASVVLNLLPVVSPYLLAGVGVDYNRVRFPLATFGPESNFLMEAHAGVGLELTFGPLNVVGDLRYCASAKVSGDHVNRVLGHDYDPSGWFASIAAGLTF